MGVLAEARERNVGDQAGQGDREKRRIRENFRRFKQLPPEQREQLRERFKDLTPEQRQRLRERMRKQ